jgi:arsenate reductase (thioredoxin)
MYIDVNDNPYKILFLCTGNSARSIFGEYLIKRIGKDRFQSYSAGTEPTGKVNSYTLRVLKEVYHIDASDARSKSCEEVNHIGFDFVITVCDRAKETCPVWPGQPIIAHWGAPDPSLAIGDDETKLKVFKQVALQIQRRIELFCALPFDKLDRLKLERLTKEIGGVETNTT